MKHLFLIQSKKISCKISLDYITLSEIYKETLLVYIAVLSK